MKYQQEEFPQLGGKTHLADGFSHMVEKADVEHEKLENFLGDGDPDKTVQCDSHNLDTNALYKELMMTKSRLASAEKKISFADPELNKVAKMTIDAQHLEYDEKGDILTVKNEEDFNTLVEQHCQAKSNRPKKIAALKNKVLAQVKEIERRQRGISISSAGSDKRDRSDDGLSETDSIKSLRLLTPAQ